MQSIDKTILNFFKANEESIKNNYPGISRKVIYEAFTDLIGVKVGYKIVPSFQQKIELEHLFSKILEGVPFAYITNIGHFFGREFFINNSVLIPRFETEELTAMATEYINELPQKSVKVGEVGVGSGCIGLTIIAECFEKQITLLGYDISKNALQIANKNLEKLSYCFPEGSEANFVLKDRLDSVEKNLFDVIISNPPYIKKDLDSSLVHHQVKKFEPAEALFLEDESYENWFNVLFQQIEVSLKSGGSFFMEGHENHLKMLKELASDFNFEEIAVKKDLSGRDRFLSLKKI